MSREFEFIVGVDEVGRGPLAGPVMVGVVKVSRYFDWKLLSGVRDSKQVPESERELIYKSTIHLKRAGSLDFAIGASSAKMIDRNGIMPAIKYAQAQAFKKLSISPDNCFVKLDGSLSAPDEFLQETIIKGDQKELSIALASIVAKVTRDRYMKRLAARYPLYTFAQHKGYGTKLHRTAIATYGFCQQHRVSYCKKLNSLYS